MKHLIISLFLLLISYSSIAQSAPDFTVTDLDGIEYHLYSDYLDQGKTVVIEFFFTTCPPCNAIAPFIPPLYESWGNGAGDVEFMAMSILVSDTNQKVADYQESHGHTFPGFGADGGAQEVLQPYLAGDFGPFEGTPTFVVIAPDRTVQFDVSGIGYQGTINAIDTAIVATGARKPYSISVFAQTPDMDTISGYEVLLDSISLGRVTLDSDGYYNTTIYLHPDSTYQLSLTKDTLYNNGVTTFDLIKISKQVLTIDTLDSPFQLLAADANRSGDISTLDIIKFRKLVLFIEVDLPDNDAWVFIREGYEFTDPENPFTEFYAGNPQKYTFVPSEIPIFKFIGIKTGDINYSANPE